MTYARPKQLLVEDNDQKGAVIGLMRRHGIVWPESEESGWPIYIHVCNGVEEVLKRSSLSARIKESELRTLGVILDADDEFDARWNRIKAFCIDHFAAVPNQFPDGGLILIGNGKRFGAWVMPDNKSCGMIETFCKTLIPESAAPIWEHALASAQGAKERGASFLDAHSEKANIYTWLAWQDPPGVRMGTAITKKILDANASSAIKFVEWFKELYEV